MLMTQLMEQVYTRIAQMPESEQDSLAALILEELDDEEQWNRKFAASSDVLSRLAQKALAEHRAGKTLAARPGYAMKSRTTADFREMFAQLPPQVQRQARAAYRRFAAGYAASRPAF